VSGPPAATAAVRLAVRRALRDLPPAAAVAVAVSGGADSLALAAAVAFERPASRAFVVDHALQPGSSSVAIRAAEQCRTLGLVATVLTGSAVGASGGPEAAARTIRYAALDAAAQAYGSVAVLLGHTRDDQAETVLLGLGRGSGPRSIAGMRAVDGRWVRPLLGIRRETTRAACAAEQLPYRDDPQNADPRFTRVRLRTEVLPLLEDVLQGGAAEALARTAGLLRDDLDALDALAAALTPDGPVLDVAALREHPRAVRTRVLRSWAGIPLSAVQLRALDALLTDWHGQGPVSLPSGRVVHRSSGMLHLARSS